MFFTSNIVFMSIGALILSRLARAHRRVTRNSPHAVTLDTQQTSDPQYSANERVQSSYLLWTFLHHRKLHLSRQQNTISHDFMRNYTPDVNCSPGNINKDLDKHNGPPCNTNRMNFCVNHSHVHWCVDVHYQKKQCWSLTKSQQSVKTKKIRKLQPRLIRKMCLW